MLSSFFGGKKRPGRRRDERSPSRSLYTDPPPPVAAQVAAEARRRRMAADYDAEEDDTSADIESADEARDGEEDYQHQGAEDEDDDQDTGREGSGPLLPIFEASQLDALPVYDLTHTIRLLIIPRCETTLSWDQLRSPQVSQFLVKPLQKEISESHFSKATLYALMSNCLQFTKEVQTSPGNAGVSKTRAMMCELLAIRLLKEFSTRELIDALSYDFYPLQGLAHATTGPSTPTALHLKPQARAARISTLEIAIRAQAKRFLAHPLVVQQLEAIWAGTIVFHHAADNAHRSPVKIASDQLRGYGTVGRGRSGGIEPERRPQIIKAHDRARSSTFSIRRTVTLYDSRDASLLKLSRLRVPRYRQFASTCSLAILLGLFIAILKERSLRITTLEVVFWVWSVGFMLDEVVGFNEQGFSLYIASIWNAFDLGILLILVCYYCLRLYGIIMPDIRKYYVAHLAYDVLAADAVLLFPRLFSVLDHYRYFSQLLIAFRMMAVDLVAVFALILISCSGFFVAFTLSFGNDDFNASDVAYALFQMLMGFTPAAWDQWPKYNILGKSILTLFLFICHFLIVTILITVLTNSFMAIVQNANDEHQFVFAVNTISLVKSDALFSYMAPTNILGWALSPLRYVLPFRQFIKINRTVIKITHFPILLVIYVYECMVLRRSAYDPSETIEERGRQVRVKPFNPRLNLFTPQQMRLREPSIATFHKDKALEEVFRRPFRDQTFQRTKGRDRKTDNAVADWMQGVGSEDTASSPAEEARLYDRSRRSTQTPRMQDQKHRLSAKSFSPTSRSVASNPERSKRAEVPFRQRPRFRRGESGITLPSSQELPEATDVGGDGDDELPEHEDPTLDDVTMDESEKSTDKENQAEISSHPIVDNRRRQPLRSLTGEDVASHRPLRTTFADDVRPVGSLLPTRRDHDRNPSTNTIVYNPQAPSTSESPPSTVTRSRPLTARNGARNTNFPSGAMAPSSLTGRKPAKRQGQVEKARPRPVMPGRTAFQSVPNIATMLQMGGQERSRNRSSLALDLASDLGDNKAIGGGFLGAMPASFQTQMAFADRMRQMQRKRGEDEGREYQQRMSRLMLARMNTLEQGFREVVQEVKDWRREGTDGARGNRKTTRAEEPRGRRRAGSDEEEEADEEEAGGDDE